jgi:hypothetical protein
MCRENLPLDAKLPRTGSIPPLDAHLPLMHDMHLKRVTLQPIRPCLRQLHLTPIQRHGRVIDSLGTTPDTPTTTMPRFQRRLPTNPSPSPAADTTRTSVGISFARPSDLGAKRREVAAHERAQGGQAGTGDGRGQLADRPEGRGDVFPGEVFEELEVADADYGDYDGADKRVSTTKGGFEWEGRRRRGGRGKKGGK